MWKSSDQQAKEVLECCQQSLPGHSGGSVEEQNAIRYADSKDSWSFEEEKDIIGIGLQAQFMLHFGKKNLTIFYILINLSETEFKMY